VRAGADILLAVQPTSLEPQAPSRKEVPIAGGQNVEWFELFDQLGMFQVIGTLPAVTESA